MEQPTASQVILTNAACLMQKQLEEVTAEKNRVIKLNGDLLNCFADLQKQYMELLEENTKLKKYANEIGEEIFRAEVSE